MLMRISKSSYFQETLIGAAVLVLLAGTAVAQKAPGDADVNQLVSEFTAAESESHAAFNRYGYKCDVVVQTLKNGKVTGEFRRSSEFSLDSSGKLVEKIISFPTPSLRDVTITPDDLEDLSSKHQFALERSNANKYKFTYAGRELVENVDTYLFDVKPRTVPAGEHLFQGHIWVRVNDRRIVKMRGKTVLKTNQSFPVVETYRAAVEGRYLFPLYSFADEDLVFQNRSSVHLRIAVRYTDYVKLQ